MYAPEKARSDRRMYVVLQAVDGLDLLSQSDSEAAVGPGATEEFYEESAIGSASAVTWRAFSHRRSRERRHWGINGIWMRGALPSR